MGDFDGLGLGRWVGDSEGSLVGVSVSVIGFSVGCAINRKGIVLCVVCL